MNILLVKSGAETAENTPSKISMIDRKRTPQLYAVDLHQSVCKLGGCEADEFVRSARPRHAPRAALAPLDLDDPFYPDVFRGQAVFLGSGCSYLNFCQISGMFRQHPDKI